jgi:hypothetical protein
MSSTSESMNLGKRKKERKVEARVGAVRACAGALQNWTASRCLLEGVVCKLDSQLLVALRL